MLVYKYFLVALCLFNFTGFAAESPYWEQYLREKKDGKVSNLREHIQNLCTLPETGVTADDLEERQKALFYFLSTGGKKGFRKTKTLPEEKAILENAHLFLGILTEIDIFASSNIDLRKAYQECDGYASDVRIFKHFTIAQQYFTVGRMITNWQYYRNPNYSRIILSNSYILPRLNSEFSNGNQTIDFASELKILAVRFTPDLVDRGLEIWNKIAKSLTDPDLSLKPSVTKGVDNIVLRQVLHATDTIVRDTLAYDHPIKIEATYVPSTGGMPCQWTSLPIKKGSRPMVISLQDGTLIIKRADSTLFVKQAKTRLYGRRNQVTYWGGTGQQTIIEDSQALTDGEILSKLGTVSPVVASFYCGNASDYENLALIDVWPEPFLVVMPKIKKFFLGRPEGRKTPNMELIKGLEEECIKQSEEGIRKLGLPAYKSPFVNNKAFVEALSQTVEQLRKLSQLEEMIDEYVEYCENLEHAIGSAVSRITFFDTAGFYQTKQSQLHANKIRKLAFDVLKKIKTCVGKIRYLSTIPLFGPSYPAQEAHEQKDVELNTLPSDPKVEEGEAAIEYADGVLDIKAKTNFTVITFEYFWIGADAKVTIDLPTSQSIISIYQRSGKPHFRLGKLTHNQGKLKIYSPWTQATTQCNNFRASRGNYVSKSVRRYPVDLSSYRDHDSESYREDSRLRGVVAVGSVANCH